MIKAFDFLLDASGDLAITASGDFATGFSDGMHLTHILEAYPGWYRESVLTGMGIKDYLHSAGMAAVIKRNAQLQIEADNYKINRISVKGDTELAFDAERIR
jgi:hypothetical protein